MAKTVAFDVEARQGLRQGIDTVARSVRITLGPRGRNVVLEKKFGAPTVTNDGVTIVREIELIKPLLADPVPMSEPVPVAANAPARVTEDMPKSAAKSAAKSAS